jgi:hypothetical protein
MQLDPGRKEEVRAAAPKSAGTAKKPILFNAILVKRKLFHIIHESSFLPNSRQFLPCRINGEFRTERQQHSGDACPSLRAAQPCQAKAVSSGRNASL